MTSQLQVVDENGVPGEKSPPNPKSLATFSHAQLNNTRDAYESREVYTQSVATNPG